MYRMGSAALCFRAVRPYVRVCCAQAEAYSDRLAAQLFSSQFRFEREGRLWCWCVRILGICKWSFLH